MFGDRTLSLQLQQSMLNVDALLTRSVQLVQNSDAPVAQKKRYYKFVGRITAILMIDVMRELIAAHPDSAPPEYLNELADNDSGLT